MVFFYFLAQMSRTTKGIFVMNVKHIDLSGLVSSTLLITLLYTLCFIVKGYML